MPRPKQLSQTPGALEVDDPRRDVLADILGATLLRNAIYRRIDGGAPWGFCVEAFAGVRYYVVARGTARFEVEGDPPRVLSAGDAIFLPHGSAHVVRDAPTTAPEPACVGPAHHRRAGRGHIKRFGGGGVTTSLIAGFFAASEQRPVLLASLPRVLLIAAADPARSPTIAATLQLLVAEREVAGPASTLIMQRLAEVLLVHVLRELATRSAGDPRQLAAMADPAVHNALELLHRGLAQPWTVAQLARRVGMSRSTFAERFAALVGEPPLQYLARWRMARAAELLRGSHAQIKEVAASVGYASVPSFNKAFRKWQGSSPSALRATASAS